MHKATLAEVLERFGQGSPERQKATAVLQMDDQFTTGKLERWHDRE
jgi:hypothetical protein